MKNAITPEKNTAAMKSPPVANNSSNTRITPVPIRIPAALLKTFRVREFVTVLSRIAIQLVRQTKETRIAA